MAATFSIGTTFNSLVIKAEPTSIIFRDYTKTKDFHVCVCTTEHGKEFQRDEPRVGIVQSRVVQLALGDQFRDDVFPRIVAQDVVPTADSLQRYLLGATDVLGLHNDLWSFQKEALIGDVHNLVIVVSHAQDCSYAEAGTKVYQMWLDKLAEMEKAIEDLGKVTPPESQHAISRYSHCARAFITGSHVFHLNTRSRYLNMNKVRIIE